MLSPFALLKRALRQRGSLALLFSLTGCGLMGGSMLGCGMNSSIAQRGDPFLDTESESVAIAESESLDEEVGRAKVVSAIEPIQYEAPQRVAAIPTAANPTGVNPNTARLAPRQRVPEAAIERIAGGPREIYDTPMGCPPDGCPPQGGQFENCPPGRCPPGCRQDGLPCPACDGMGEDEYLCDGGDRDYPIHYEAGQMAGLDTEDAAVEYRDSTGKLRVLPTNKVCIYSPRFSAITAINEPNENQTFGQLAGSKGAIKGGDIVRQQALADHHQRDRLSRFDRRKRGSELFNPTLRDELHNAVAPEIHDQTIIVYNDFTYIRTGIMVREEEARLKLGIQGALDWTRVQNPVIAGHLNAASKIESSFRGMEMTGREPPSKPGILKICKLADRRVAKQGDIVTFTIRYDNLGDLPVSNVNITDNLTPRMEYIPDSATCDRAGKLIAEDNFEGSLILKWVLDEPVLGHTGGTISFKARVR